MCLKTLLLPLFLLFAPLSYAQSIPVDINDFVWDLSVFFPDETAWEQSRQEVLNRVQQLEFYSRTKPSDPEELARTLQMLHDVREQAALVAIYGTLSWELDGVSEAAEFRFREGERIVGQIEAAASRLEHQVLAIGSKTLKKWVAKEPKLYPHRHRLNLIIDFADHTPHPEARAVVEELLAWPLLSSEAWYAAVDQPGMNGSVVDKKGSEHTVNRSYFRKNRRLSDRTLRDQIGLEHMQLLEANRELFTTLYQGKIQATNKIMGFRNYLDGITGAFHWYGGMPEGAHDTLIKAARANRSTLLRYLNLRKSILGLDTLRYLDLYWQPDFIRQRDFSFQEAIDLSLEAAGVLGPDFSKRMRELVESPKGLHFANTPNLGGNYHLHDPVGDQAPFYLCRFKPKSHIHARALSGGLISYVSSMYAMGSPANDQAESRAVGIYGNAMIYLGDQLYDEALINKLDNVEQKRALLLEMVAFLQNHFYKWALLSELDHHVQQSALNGQPMSGEEISATYLNLLREYYGQEEGHLQIDPAFGNNWMTETRVFFMPNYEHHFWSAALAASAALLEGVESKRPDVMEAVLQDYSGDRYDSHSLLMEAGVDLTQTNGYDALFRRMNALMDRIEALGRE